MHGASISRWTMAYFAASIAFLLAGLASVGCGYGTPASIDAPDTLAIVHLIVIGWLGLLFCGALLQFVPVLAATHLRLPWLAAPALLALVLGLGLLTAGFLALAGHVSVEPVVMSAGGFLLAFGFGCLIAALTTTIVAQQAFGISGLLVLVGLIALAVTIALGNVFAALLVGIIDLPSLASRLTELAPYHAGSGVLGWMTITAVGVSYRLFAMFMLAPERPSAKNPIAITAVCALVALYSAVVLRMMEMAGAQTVSILAVTLLVLFVGLYGYDIARMFKARRRKALELNSLTGLAALGFLALGAILLLCAISLDTRLAFAAAAFYLLIMGWLTGLGLGQLYKIIPFLTWLETYGPVMGRQQVPRVQDLVDERHARLWFAVFYLSVLAGAAGLLFGLDLLFRAASLFQCAAVAALAVEYLRARCLTYAPYQLRLPPGVVRPHIIYAMTQTKE
ncbi:hypothetical protein LJR030_002009 [Rhizobium sp. LjRoot30]|uniref:hypothetical protein n=1 Tax=Rhizobium sp. LjRoot30 TaxID=3342320 RepID=UPI003ED11F13